MLPSEQAGKIKNLSASLNKEITINKVTVGDTTISGGGLTIEDGPSVTKDGIQRRGEEDYSCSGWDRGNRCSKLWTAERCGD